MYGIVFYCTVDYCKIYLKKKKKSQMSYFPRQLDTLNIFISHDFPQEMPQLYFEKAIHLSREILMFLAAI